MEYYRVVVGMRGISPSFFWYEMSNQEVSEICKAQQEINKGEIERTRTISYWAASGMSKMPKIDKWWPLPWDDEVHEEELKNRRKPSKNRMNAIINRINGNKLQCKDKSPNE